MGVTLKGAEVALQNARDSYFKHKRILENVPNQIEQDKADIKYWEGYIAALKQMEEVE